MFNTTIHRTTTEVTPVTRVVEKSITPDKVTDVYKDIRKEVEDTILRTFRIESTYMNGIVMECEKRYDTLQVRLHMRFELNGKEHIGQTDIQEGSTTEQLYKACAEFFSDKIVGILMNDFSAKHLKQLK